MPKIPIWALEVVYVQNNSNEKLVQINYVLTISILAGCKNVITRSPIAPAYYIHQSACLDHFILLKGKTAS
jgi:hypothetical protein